MIDIELLEYLETNLKIETIGFPRDVDLSTMSNEETRFTRIEFIPLSIFKQSAKFKLFRPMVWWIIYPVQFGPMVQGLVLGSKKPSSDRKFSERNILDQLLTGLFRFQGDHGRKIRLEMTFYHFWNFEMIWNVRINQDVEFCGVLFLALRMLFSIVLHKNEKFLHKLGALEIRHFLQFKIFENFWLKIFDLGENYSLL